MQPAKSNTRWRVPCRISDWLCFLPGARTPLNAGPLYMVLWSVRTLNSAFSSCQPFHSWNPRRTIISCNDIIHLKEKRRKNGVDSHFRGVPHPVTNRTTVLQITTKPTLDPPTYSRYHSKHESFQIKCAISHQIFGVPIRYSRRLGCAPEAENVTQ